MNPFDYCRDKATPEGSAGYYTVLFQPPRARPALTALLALERELQEVVEACSELPVGEHKLAFWRDELARAAAGMAAHPVSRALAEHAAGATDAALLDALIAGVHRRMTTPQYRDDAELDRSCEETAGVLGEAMSRVLAPGDAGAASALREASAAAERVRLLGFPRRAGLPPHTGIPLDALSAAGATPAQADRGGAAPELARLRAVLLARAHERLARAGATLASPRGLAATRLAMARARLDALERAGYVTSGADERGPLPMTLLWRAWRHRPPRGAAA